MSAPRPSRTPARKRAPAPRDARAASENRYDLSSLFEFSSIINASVDLTFILGHFLLTLMGKLLSLRAVVLLSGAERGTFSVENVKGLPSSLLGSRVRAGSVPRTVTAVTPAARRKYPWLSFFAEHGITLVVPLVADGRVLGLAGFAPAKVRGRLSALESTYVRSLANIAASAIAKGLVISQLEESNRRLTDKIRELNTLFELGKEFSAVLDAERLVKLLMYSVMGQVGAQRYVLCLVRDGHLTVASSRLDAEIPESACAVLSGLQAPTAVAALKRAPAAAREGLGGAGIELLVPLLHQGETKGVLGLGRKMRGGDYTASEGEFLASLGNIAIISLENARLFREALEKQKLEDELLIAKQIQRGLLPASLPMIPRCEIGALNLSSKQVGGDYYDVIQISASRFVIAIGDVSGKGAPASLLMANLQAAIRALVPLGLPLAELTRLVNDLLCDNTGGERFITFFWGILDVEEGTFRYVSAGHNPPMLFRPDGSRELLDKGGLILGIMKTMRPYEEGCVAFSAGDLLVLYTDGVSEAMSASSEEWGEERLEALVRARRGASPDDLIDAVVAAVKEHARDTVQSDDITLVVVRMHA